MKPTNVPYHLVTEHELGYLSNEVLEKYPGASDEFLEVALRERILEFDELARWEEEAEMAVTDFDGMDLDDYEGPNHPCNYCYAPGMCARCKGFEHSQAMKEAIADGVDPVKAFPDLSEEDRRALEQRWGGNYGSK